MRFEVRVTVDGKTGRIKVLAANPRTARGFSGDLILDEFAFHEDSAAIWEAAEPIISSNPDFLCRILSTGNGRRNMFYQLISEGRIKYRRIRRSDAWAHGRTENLFAGGRPRTSRPTRPARRAATNAPTIKITSARSRTKTRRCSRRNSSARPSART